MFILVRWIPNCVTVSLNFISLHQDNFTRHWTPLRWPKYRLKIISLLTARGNLSTRQLLISNKCSLGMIMQKLSGNSIRLIGVAWWGPHSFIGPVITDTDTGQSINNSWLITKFQAPWIVSFKSLLSFSNQGCQFTLHWCVAPILFVWICFYEHVYYSSSSSRLILISPIMQVNKLWLNSLMLDAVVFVRAARKCK